MRDHSRHLGNQSEALIGNLFCRRNQLVSPAERLGNSPLGERIHPEAPYSSIAWRLVAKRSLRPAEELGKTHGEIVGDRRTERQGHADPRHCRLKILHGVRVGEPIVDSYGFLQPSPVVYEDIFASELHPRSGCSLPGVQREISSTVVARPFTR